VPLTQPLTQTLLQPLARGLIARRAGGAAPVPVWTPASIGAEVWFDASDLSSMKQDRTGASATVDAAVDSPVGSWLNKGTFGGWITAPNDSARPVLRAASGLYRLDFDGVDDRLSGALGLLRNVSAWTLAVTTQKATLADQKRILHIGVNDDGSGNIRAGLFSRNGSAAETRVIGRRVDEYGSASVIVSDDYVSQNVVLVSTGNYATTTALLRKNGVQVASNTSWLSSGTTPNSGGGIVIGAGPNIDYWDGFIYQGVVKQAVVGGSDLSSLETFLGAKAGLTI